MPAYSFKERFVPFVKDGSKPHTIRARRKRQSIKKGDTLYLYYGLRTKHCTKLREETCSDVRTIIITKTNIYLMDRRLTDEECDGIKDCDAVGFKALKNCHEFGFIEKDQLAWRDGFRPEGSTLEEPVGSFDLMMRFWNQTHELPFIGDIIYWQPYKTKAKNYDFNSRNNLETSYY